MTPRDGALTVSEWRFQPQTPYLRIKTDGELAHFSYIQKQPPDADTKG